MSTEPHTETDPDLWVEVAGFEGKLYLMGNPHTYPGRITAWSYDRNHSLYFSKGEVAAASEAARRWIDGYLHGSEPELEMYLGLDASAVGEVDDDDPRVEQWRQALAEFRKSGQMSREWYERYFRPTPNE